MTFSLLWTERKEISTGKEQIRLFGREKSKNIREPNRKIKKNSQIVSRPRLSAKMSAELSEGASWSRYKILAKKRRLSETNVLIVLALYPFRDSTAIPKVHAVFEFALTAATKKIVAVSP